MFGERRAEALEVAAAEGDGASPSRAVGRIGEADELVPFLVDEELDDRREAPVARALLHGELLQDLCRTPGCRRFRHGPEASRKKHAWVARRNVPRPRTSKHPRRGAHRRDQARRTRGSSMW